MSDSLAPSDRLAEVERLTAALTDQILDAQIMRRSIPAEQAHALAKGARLLHDNGLPWPPMLAEVLQTVMDSRSEAKPETEPSAEVADAPQQTGLSRFLGIFRSEKADAKPDEGLRPDQLTTENDGGAQG